MKILEIFAEKLRYKNYSPRTISVYKSYLKNFLQYNNVKDPYQVTTEIYTHVSNQLLNKINLPI